MKRIRKTTTVYTALVSLFIVAALTFSSSLAKHFFRVEYPMKLALAEHFTFSPGAAHSFVIPHDGYYAFQLWGGDGGESKNAWNSGAEIYELGGSGAMVTAVSYFRKDEVLTVTVGTKGDIITGGFNGGGYGGTDLAPIFNDYYGGGGGGATDIRLSTTTLDGRILVAGGGGGGSGGRLSQNGTGYRPARGGDGGTEAGENGSGEGFGLGGDQTSGGAGHQYGSLGDGGGGQYSGGGGGGGYYGGGGAYGSGGGGGGGSSYIGDGLIPETPVGLPDRSYFSANENDGYAIVSFLGDAYIAPI